MKEAIMTLMGNMMPYMFNVMWAGVVIAVIALLLIILRMIIKSNQSLGTGWLIGLVFVFAVFFLGSQGMGYLFGMDMSLNMGDAKKFEFINVGFWVFGLSFLVAGFILKFLNRIPQVKTATA